MFFTLFQWGRGEEAQKRLKFRLRLRLGLRFSMTSLIIESSRNGNGEEMQGKTSRNRDGWLSQDTRLWRGILTFLDTARRVASEAEGARKSRDGNEEAWRMGAHEEAAPRVRRNLTDVCVFALVLTGSDAASTREDRLSWCLLRIPLLPALC